MGTELNVSLARWGIFAPWTQIALYIIWADWNCIFMSECSAKQQWMNIKCRCTETARCFTYIGNRIKTYAARLKCFSVCAYATWLRWISFIPEEYSIVWIQLGFIVFYWLDMWYSRCHIVCGKILAIVQVCGSYSISYLRLHPSVQNASENCIVVSLRKGSFLNNFKCWWQRWYNYGEFGSSPLRC